MHEETWNRISKIHDAFEELSKNDKETILKHYATFVGAVCSACDRKDINLIIEKWFGLSR